MDSVPFTTLGEFLIWVGTPAGLALMGGTISATLRDNGWFEGLSSTKKSTIMWVLCVIVLPVVLVYLPQSLSPEFVSSVEPLFKAILLGGIAYAGNQGVHEFWNTRVDRRRSTDIIGKQMMAVDTMPAKS